VNDTQRFALIVLLAAAVGLVAVLSNRLTERVKVPSPAIVLVGAAIAVKVVPALHAPPRQAVERVVTVALVFILFDGGMHIGWSRFRSAAGPIAIVGVAGTFLTTAAAAAFAHVAFGLPWYLAVLVATAIAPTDPAVVFSVLGQHEISGRSGTILEGESGANDPVGIALMASLIAAGGLSAGAFAAVGAEFAVQMAVGAVVGVAGGLALLWFIRRVPLPSEGLYPLRTLTCALLIFAAATLARGSGFLAVFAAGIALGDGRAPYKREIERFHTALASLAEIVAFVALGLTVDLAVIARTDVWVPGLILGAVLAFVIRPALAGLSLIPARLERNERNFVLFAGLKGAVPILLGIFLLEARLPGAGRLYGIIAVVVVFSVVVQGSLIPSAARLLRVQMRSVEPQPWALGVRLRDEPSGVHHLTVRAGAAADGRAVGEIPGLPGDAWVSFVVRDGQLAPIAGDMRLRPGDEVLVLADPRLHEQLATAFEGRLRPRLQRAAREGAGFVDELGPPGVVAVVYQDPFAEGPARGGERLARARPDELLDAMPGELDDEVAGAVVAGGEERARDAQAGKAHHRPGRHVVMGQRGRAGLPEEIGGPLSHARLLPCCLPGWCPARPAAGSRWRPASAATPPGALRRSPRRGRARRPSRPRRRPTGQGTPSWCAR
jgi:cell volume regulation protein A